MTNPITSNNPFDRTGDASTPTASAKSKEIDKNMFLQLMVAQLRNQDPLNPTQGAEFVAQLAQFQQLEQSQNISQDIAALRGIIEQYLTPQA